MRRRNKDSYDKLIINMISICNTNNIKENNENYTEVHVKYENVIKQYNTDRGRSWSYGSWIYNYLCNQCLSPLTLWIRIPFRRVALDTTLRDAVCQWLATGRWFSPISSTNRTNRHDIAEILLNVVLSTISLTL